MNDVNDIRLCYKDTAVQWLIPITFWGYYLQKKYWIKQQKRRNLYPNILQKA